MKKNGERLVKIAGILEIILGFVIVFAAFFIMQETMMAGDYEGPDAMEQMKITRNIGLGATYAMVFGAANCIVGFFGTLNWDNDEYSVKCRKYGIILVALCVINAALLSIFGDVTKPFVLAIVLLPLIIDGAYLVGAVIKIKAAGAVGEEENKAVNRMLNKSEDD